MQVGENSTGSYRTQIDGKEIILLGTAHVSRQSADLVESVIEAERPDTVCVELCPSRYKSIMQKDKWLETDIIKVIREKKVFLLLSSLLLASFQKRIGDKIGIKPGEEMIRAIDAAKAVGADICLADRDITVTLSRTWRSTGFLSKLKLLFQLMLSMGEVEDIDEKDVEQMKEADMLESILAEVEKKHPSLRKILIDERDQYLAEKIRTSPGGKTVAVVGAGHVPGIRRYLSQELDIRRLETLPPKGKAGRILKWALPAAILILILSGFFYSGPEAGKNMITGWILFHGLFAGIGALIAFGHPFTILSAAFVAPLTSLNPMIAAGWVSGLVEAFVRKPKVRDMAHLSEDILSVRGFWRNKVTRILLVVIFTNLGSSIGTFVALPWMMRAFGA